MTYHLKNWEYFIEISCFIPGEMIKLLSDSLKSLKIPETAFSRIVNTANCVRTRDGLETIILLTLHDYIGETLIPLTYDKILENIDNQIEGLKENWAENHIIII